jgi:hypothetical protein
LQHGVNFLNQEVTLLLIGGTVYHKCQEKAPGYLDDLALIAQGALYDSAEPHVLRPNGRVLLDAQYLVSILGGLYGRVDPELALRVMKRELLPLEIPALAASTDETSSCGPRRGNGAHAFAGDLARRGYRARLYNKFANEIADLQSAGGVTVDGVVDGFGKLDLITTDIAPWLPKLTLFWSSPANAHGFMAEACAPSPRWASDRLNPDARGRTRIQEHPDALGVRARLFIAETQTSSIPAIAGPRARISISRTIRLRHFRHAIRRQCWND